MERMLETFFRRWWLNLIPFFLCCALGLMAVLNQSKGYLSEGTLSVSSNTLVAELADKGGDNSFGPSAAEVASQRINEQLRSAEFVAQLVERAGLVQSLEAGLIGPDFVRQRVLAIPEGEFLLKVRSVTEDPELSLRLATSAIETYIQTVIDDNLADSQTAESFYEGLAATYAVNVEAAREALDEYLIANPAPPFGSRPQAEQTQVDQLSAELERAAGQYSAAQARIDEARLASELTIVDVRQRLRILDQPTKPVTPISGLRSMVFSFAVFVVLGGILTTGLVALTAFLDKTIRTPDEVGSRLGIDLVATVPAVSLSGFRDGR